MQSCRVISEALLQHPNILCLDPAHPVHVNPNNQVRLHPILAVTLIEHTTMIACCDLGVVGLHVVYPGGRSASIRVLNVNQTVTVTLSVVMSVGLPTHTHTCLVQAQGTKLRITVSRCSGRCGLNHSELTSAWGEGWDVILTLNLILMAGEGLARGVTR